MTMSSPIGSPAAGLRGAPLDGRLLPTLPTAYGASLLSLRPHSGACADRLASPALPMTEARTSARRPRRPRRARIARRSSGECQGGCGVQAASLRPLPTRRGAAVGAAAGLPRCGLRHRVLSTSPTPPAAAALEALLSSPVLGVRLMTALQVLQVPPGPPGLAPQPLTDQRIAP